MDNDMNGHDEIPAAPVSGMYDFSLLYEEFKVKLSCQDRLKKEFQKLMTGYYDLKNKYNDLERKSVEGVRIMRANYDSVITIKDKQIADQDRVIEEYDEKLWILVANHEKELKQKDEELATQNNTIKGLKEDKDRKPMKLNRQEVSTGELFRLVPKTRGSKTMLQLQILTIVNSLNATKPASIRSNVTPAQDGYAKAAMMYRQAS